MGLMNFIESVCVQDAVYWTGTPDGYGGYTWQAHPVKVRWDDTTEVVTDSSGKEVVSRARILSLHPMKQGRRLYLGSIDNLSDDEKDNPLLVESYEIKRVDRNPLFKSTTEFVQTVYL